MPAKPGAGFHPDDLILEVHLQQPVLHVEAGKFISGSELLHLAILHPRKLAVYTVTGASGTVEHGNQYQLRLMYEHNLQRTACNMTCGPFGEVKGRDFICIQSMDGMLSFFEQESFVFGRFLPGFLIPGPLTYNRRTDSFITVSSQRCVESYRYQALAVATDADSRQEWEQQKLSSGKKLVADWSLNIGEQALDVQVAAFSQAPPSIFVLGERNVYCLKENGRQLRFMKKLEYNPSCILPYASVSEGTVHSVVGTHSRSLLVYQDNRLRWAAQLPHVPVAVRIATFQDLRGILVTLSAEGQLQCSYLGTDPSLFQAPRVEARDLNYTQTDAEMRELTKLIREATRTKDILPAKDKDDDLTVTIAVSSSLDSASVASGIDISGESVPSISVKITVQSRRILQSVKVMVSVREPLSVTRDMFTYYTLEAGRPTAATVSVFLKQPHPPAELQGEVVVHYSTPTGVPRVVKSAFTLPLVLACHATSPAKSAQHKLTVDTNKPPVSLAALFPDFLQQSEEGQVNALGFQLLRGSRVTVLASKTSQRYRVQCDQLDELWLVTSDLVRRLESHFRKQLGTADFKCSFMGPLPLQEYFELLDQHFDVRADAEKYREMLSERAVQFRAVQRRLLTRFKDKTPSPLQNLDSILEGTYQQIVELADMAQDTEARLTVAASRLRAATRLLVLLLSLWQSLSPDEVALLHTALLPELQDNQQLGWEESVDTALSYLLRTCLAKSGKDQALTPGGGGGGTLAAPRDTARLKKHLALLCERLGKGGRLLLSGTAASSSSDAAQQSERAPSACSDTIVEEPEVEVAEAAESPSRFAKRRNNATTRSAAQPAGNAPSHSHHTPITSHSHHTPTPSHSHHTPITSHSHHTPITLPSHHTPITLPSHHTPITLPSHSHPITLPSHHTPIPSHSHHTPTPSHSHHITLPSHSHPITLPSHSHHITLPSHSHPITLPSHSHHITLQSHHTPITLPPHHTPITLPSHHTPITSHSHHTPTPSHSHHTPTPSHSNHITLPSHSHPITLSSHHTPITLPPHHTPITLPSHHTPITLPPHHTPITLPSHHTPITLPPHHTPITLPSHHTPITLPSHSHHITLPSHSHPITLPSHSHPITLPSHSHHITLPSHSHPITLPSHHTPITLPPHHTPITSHSHHTPTPSHSHHITLPSHSHHTPITSHSHHTPIPSHSHPITLPSHHTPTPSHSHHTPIPSHSHHTPTPSHSHHTPIPSHSHHTPIPSHSHLITLPSHHTPITLPSHHTPTPSHSHPITLPSHHTPIPSHSHPITLPPHHAAI
ncbi:protein PTHB1 isoform X2 [Lampetra planeri]